MKRVRAWLKQHKVTLGVCALTAVLAWGAATALARSRHFGRLQASHATHAAQVVNIRASYGESLSHASELCEKTLLRINDEHQALLLDTNAQWKTSFTGQAIAFGCQGFVGDIYDECKAHITALYKGDEDSVFDGWDEPKNE